MTTPRPAYPDRRVLYVLALLEAGMQLLEIAGGTFFMGGDPWYAGIGTAVAAVYVVAGQATSRGRRWGCVTLFAAEALRLTGFGVSVLLGVTPWLQTTVTGATLVDAVFLPVAVATMALRRMMRPSLTVEPVA